MLATIEKIEIKKAGIQDIEFLDYVFNHPDIYPYITDDGCPESLNISLAGTLSNPLLNFYIPSVYGENAGMFILVQNNSITFEVHTLILPKFRGNQLVEICKTAIDFIFKKTKCLKLITQVPTCNYRAYALAYKSNMRQEGINKKSWLKEGILYDQYIMGISKGGRIKCQQQLL